jgi:EmrB/QacA subfamily drug resistance transporter
MESSTPRRPDPVIHDPRQRRAVLISVCLALMAVVASVSGLNVAQQEIARAFDASQTTVLWIINIYTLTLAALLMPLGAIGDRWGRKPVLLAGLTLFGAASATAAVATSSEIMIAARFAGGAGAAMIMPVTLAVITSTFPDQERSQAIGVWSGVAGAGGLLGMFLSATLLDLADWRYQFVLPIVLVAVAVPMTMRSIPNTREEKTTEFDAVGSLLSAVAIVGLVFAIHEGPSQGWAAPATLGSLVVGVIGAIAFVAWERRRQAPLFDVRLFRERGLASGSVTLLSLFGVMGGVFVVIFPFFQTVLGWSGLRATLGLLPMAFLMMVTSGIAPRIAAKVGGRWTMASGILLAGAGLALMATFVSTDGGYLSVLPGMVAMGLGAGLTMPPSTEAITTALPRARQGVASALNDVTREFGTALGVALLGTVLTVGYRSAIDPQLAGIPGDIANTAREGVANALTAAESAGPQAHFLVRAAQEAFVDGWQQATWVGVGAMAILLAYVIARGPRHTRLR